MSGRDINFDRAGLESGCTQIFGNVVVTPHDNLSACCGLTLEHIPEMRLGRNSGSNMLELYRQQSDDFLKFWIHVDGPYSIVKRLLGESAGSLLANVRHICQACVILHKTPQVRERLAHEYPKYVQEILTRFALQMQFDRSSVLDVLSDEKAFSSNVQMEVSNVSS